MTNVGFWKKRLVVTLLAVVALSVFWATVVVVIKGLALDPEAAPETREYPEPPPGSYEVHSLTLQWGDDEYAVDVAAVPVTFFTDVVGPLIGGRGLMAADYETGAPLVAVVGEDLMKEASPGRDPIGREITLDGQVYVIVGVMAGSFDSPGGVGLWIPLVDGIP